MTLLMAPYPATTIASEFLRAAETAGTAITHMKLQKLVYLAHGWYLAFSECQPLIEERVRAWQYGPVIQELYTQLAHYGRRSITRSYFAEVFNDPAIPQDDRLAHYVVGAVWDSYGHYTGYQLSTLTHQDNTPWDQAKRQCSSVIPDETIRDHFAQLAAA